MEGSGWRKTAAPIIARVLAETRGKSDKEIQSALTAAYPFGMRKFHPYKIWLDEIKVQRGRKSGTKRSDSLKLEEWQKIYGKRTA